MLTKSQADRSVWLAFTKLDVCRLLYFVIVVLMGKC